MRERERERREMRGEGREEKLREREKKTAQEAALQSQAPMLACGEKDEDSGKRGVEKRRAKGGGEGGE